jgi:hypothetical protein
MTKTKKLLSLTTSLLHSVQPKSILTRACPSPEGRGHRPVMSAMWNNPLISLHNFNDLAHHNDDFVATDGIGRGNELQERLECISGL